jgi:hypothetical protein
MKYVLPKEPLFFKIYKVYTYLTIHYALNYNLTAHRIFAKKHCLLYLEVTLLYIRKNVFIRDWVFLSIFDKVATWCALQSRSSHESHGKYCLCYRFFSNWQPLAMRLSCISRKYWFKLSKCVGFCVPTGYIVNIIFKLYLLSDKVIDQAYTYICSICINDTYRSINFRQVLFNFSEIL